MSKRGAWQLARLTLGYSERAGNSRTLREFVRDRLPAFRASNPWLEVVTAKTQRHPYLKGEYRNGKTHHVEVKNLPMDELEWHVSHLRSENGRHAHSLPKRELRGRKTSSMPSLQGQWRWDHPSVPQPEVDKAAWLAVAQQLPEKLRAAVEHGARPLVWRPPPRSQDISEAAAYAAYEAHLDKVEAEVKARWQQEEEQEANRQPPEGEQP
mmetsp:Transcript_9534/g.33205  ORF Transcript_9534/g.33205 Transcript_9534/m.33205 type:complete len:210 (-) Transcript_9534:56-685(-)